MEEDPVVQKERRLNAYISFSFVFIFCVVGIPIWWYTTTVYRVALPTDRIERLSQFELTLPLSVRITGNKDLNPGDVAALLQTDFNQFKTKQVTFKFYYEAVVSHETTDPETRKSEKDSGAVRLDVKLKRSTIDQIVVSESCQSGVVVEAPLSAKSPDIAKSIKNILLDAYLTVDQLPTLIESTEFEKCEVQPSEPITIDSIVSSVEKYVKDLVFMTGTKEPCRLSGHKRKKPHHVSAHLSPLPEYNIDIILLNPKPNKTCIPRLNTSRINDFVQFAFAPLSAVSRLRVSSQSIFYSDIPHKATKKESGDESIFVIPKHVLPHLISPIEKYIAPNMARDGATLHFVVYLPPEKRSPLYIGGPESSPLERESFVISSWGAFSIYNGYKAECVEIDSPCLDSKKIAEKIVPQLRHLLSLPVTFGRKTENCPLSKLEADRATIYAVLHHILQSTSSLQSLVKLLDNIPNIVINDNVGNDIKLSVDLLERSLDSLREGSWDSALKSAKSAYQVSERAFFDESLLSLMYFPDDQKFAIYIPLFVPVGMPILLALIHYVRSAFKKPNV